MVRPLKDITQEAIQLPRHQRLVLARLLLDLDEPGEIVEIDETWDQEIRARVKAYDEGRVEGISYDKVKEKIHRRLSS